MTNFYRRIPRVVRALQFIFTDSFEAELREFAGDLVTLSRKPGEVVEKVHCRQTAQVAIPGDWIVEYQAHEFMVIRSDLFGIDFEPFPAPPVRVVIPVQLVEMARQRKIEMMRSLSALYLEVPEAVANDVKQNFTSYCQAIDDVLQTMKQFLEDGRA